MLWLKFNVFEGNLWRNDLPKVSVNCFYETERTMRKMEIFLGLAPCSVDNQKQELFWSRNRGFGVKDLGLIKELVTMPSGQFLTLT